MNELIEKARQCTVCMLGLDEESRQSCEEESCIGVIDALADALEAKEKDLLSALETANINAKLFDEATARAEKAEAEREEYKAALMNWRENEPERNEKE